MDHKSCHSSAADSSSSSTPATTSNNNGGSSSSKDQQQHYLNHLNKLSHKISKPISRKPPFDPHHRFNPPPPPAAVGPPPPPPPPQIQSQPQPQQQQHQPPVYNINKSDFRDVVQKLTGSPAHERFSTPPPIQPPKAPSSRLQRIRPPPLAQISNRPPPLLPTAADTAIHSRRGVQLQPLSPLPPFPSVHTAAESPISAYMRFFHTVSSRPQFQHQQNIPPPPLPPPQQNIPPPQQYQIPSSPLPFGCLSPRSPYPLLSPNLLSPTTAAQLGFHQFPVSPRLPVPSPGWKDY